MSYWDTSALLKLYLIEGDSASFRGLVRPGLPRVTGFIGKHEMRTVFRRREAEGVIAKGGSVVFFDRLLDDLADGWLTLIPETAALEVAFAWVLERCLSQVPPVFIRTNDALHIAAAKVAGETEFVSADKHQRAAAAFLGFTVLPAVYPILTPTP